MKFKFPIAFRVLFVVLSLSTMAFIPIAKDEVEGAWTLKERASETIIIFSDGYCSFTRYSTENKKFHESFGGPYTLSNNALTIRHEFNTTKAALIGADTRYKYRIEAGSLYLKDEGAEKQYLRVDKGEANLAGTWKISGRKQNGVLAEIHQAGPRKTIKILSASRFQWAAINPETKEFFGTGGGTYTLDNGRYTEHIKFFSRDSSRVGLSLQFEGKVIDGKWHHSGKSSRGDDIYEVWSRIKD